MKERTMLKQKIGREFSPQLMTRRAHRVFSQCACGGTTTSTPVASVARAASVRFSKHRSAG
jgi:hypothetical protein